MPLESDHPLHGFKLKACLDWIELRLELPSESQPQHVRARMPTSWGKPFVHAVGADSSRTSRTFVFRLQNPPSADEFMRDVQSLVKPGERAITSTDIEVIGIEPAIDAYPRTEADRTPEALARVAHHFHRHHARPPEGVPRITEPGHFRAAARPRDNLRALAAGWTINSGDRATADFATRAYVKRFDTLNGESYAPLPTDQHRARFELTLRGNARPFKTIEEWRSFRFKQLAPLFAMVCSTSTPADGLLHLLAQEKSQLGRPDDAALRAAHRRQRAASTRRDSVLNKRVHDALRSLTTRTAKAAECGNFGISEAAESAPLEGKAPEMEKSPKYLNTLRKTL